MAPLQPPHPMGGLVVLGDRQEPSAPQGPPWAGGRGSPMSPRLALKRPGINSSQRCHLLSHARGWQDPPQLFPGQGDGGPHPSHQSPWGHWGHQPSPHTLGTVLGETQATGLSPPRERRPLGQSQDGWIPPPWARGTKGTFPPRDWSKKGKLPGVAGSHSLHHPQLVTTSRNCHPSTCRPPGSSKNTRPDSDSWGQGTGAWGPVGGLWPPEQCSCCPPRAPLATGTVPLAPHALCRGTPSSTPLSPSPPWDAARCQPYPVPSRTPRPPGRSLAPAVAVPSRCPPGPPRSP